MPALPAWPSHLGSATDLRSEAQIVRWYARNVQVANAAVATDKPKSSARCSPTEPHSVRRRTTSRAAITPQLTGLNFAAICIQCGTWRTEITVDEKKTSGSPRKVAIAI